MTLTLFEHETAPFDCAPRDLILLERLNREATLLRPTLRGQKPAIQATEYVGVIRLGSRAIQVLPKMYRADRSPGLSSTYPPTPSLKGRGEVNANPLPLPSEPASVLGKGDGGLGQLAVSNGEGEWEVRSQATRNLLYLLETAGNLPVRAAAVAPLWRRGADWFEILTRLFAVHLQEAWAWGAVRCYETFGDDLPVFRGKLRLAEQLRRPDRRHRFAVADDEFTADNPLNRVFRFVVERLWNLTRDGDNRARLGELRLWMEEVTLLPSVTLADADPARLTRLHRRYEPLLNLARLFLDGGALQLTPGQTPAFAFVFDMNRLFESFVIAFLRRHREAILPEALRTCELLPQARGVCRHLACAGDQRLWPLRPDLVFRQGDSFPLLLDTKYKRLNPAERSLGIQESDLYQMAAYAHRFASPRVLLLYPQTADLPEPLHRRFTLEGTDRLIEVATLDLRGDFGQSEERKRLMDRLREVIRRSPASPGACERTA